jgi:periplasmic divalent cation tolerance protein
MSETSNMILVQTNLPDREVAENMARHLVATKLAACVSIMAPCTSIYHWQGKIESATEIPLLIKTTKQRYAAVETVIRELHPYELPEILYVTVDGGLPAYIQWVQQETSV